MTDEELIVRWKALTNYFIGTDNTELTRLLSLARRGAATQWRPIADIPKNEEIFAQGRIWRWDGQKINKRPRPYWACNLGPAWSIDNQPTHGIMLSVLGAPEPKP